MAGRVADAEALLSQHAPGLVGPAGDNCIYFYLSCLKFIELVRCAPPGVAGKRQGQSTDFGRTCFYILGKGGHCLLLLCQCGGVLARASGGRFGIGCWNSVLRWQMSADRNS